MFKNISESTKSYLKEHSKQILSVLLKVFLVLLIYGMLSLVYHIFNLIVPKFCAFLLVTYVAYRTLLLICRVMTFPGSTWLWRRNVENHFQKAFVLKIKKKISALRGLCEYILEERFWNQACTEEELNEIKRMISSVIFIYEKQKSHKTITERQLEMMGYFTEIEQLLHETKIYNRSADRTYTFWEILEGVPDLEEDKSKFVFIDKNDGHYLTARCRNLEIILNEITAKKKTVENIKRWIKENSFGTIDHLREELMNRYDCKRIMLNVSKKITLDCMYIYGKGNDEGDRKDMTQNELTIETLDPNSSRRPNSNPTMIICCPNAGYYEFLYYENEWIDFFVKCGLNVFLWNYRGYGRSTGVPSPEVLRKDGEAVVDYLRNELGVKKIGVHGESLGGLVATHLARVKQLDFLCADRTFSSLSSVGEISFGTWVGRLYRFLTLWNDSIADDYVETNCYKVLTFDPKDEVIHLLSSLKYGITRKVLEKRMGVRDEPPRLQRSESYKIYAPHSWLNFFTQAIQVAKREKRNNRIKAQLEQYYDLLNREQTIALFWAFHRISEVFIALSSVQNITNIKKHRRAHSSEVSGRAKPTLARPFQPGKPGGGSLESSINTSSINPIKAREININDDSCIGLPMMVRHDESMSFMNDSRMLNETIDLKSLTQSDDIYLMSTIKRPSYLHLFDEDAKASDDVLSFLVKAFTAVEVLESGGTRISDIMSFSEDAQFDSFKDFIFGLEIWGAYHPLERIPEDEPNDISYYQGNATTKIREFVKRIDHIIHKHRHKPSTLKTNKLISSIVEDLELISSIIPSLYQKLLVRNNKIMDPNDQSSPCNQDLEDKQIKAGERFIELSDKTLQATTQVLGHLIPLSCGHNGVPKAVEIEAYEYHLRNSKFLEQESPQFP